MRFVLVRGFPSSITETVFARGVEKLYRNGDVDPTGARPKSLRRVLLVRDRVNDKSMGFGFAEFHTVQDARHAVERARRSDLWDFTIGSRSVSVCFPHSGVFPPADFGRVERDKMYTFRLKDKEQDHKYHDDRYYARELVVNAEVLHYRSESPGRTTETESKSNAAAGQKRAIDTLDSGLRTKKAKAAPKAAPGILQNWQKKQAELRGDAEQSISRDEPASGVIDITTSANESSESTEQTFAHSGTKIACYLCASQFETMDHITKHLEQSKTHADNLHDEAVVKRAYHRMKNKGIETSETIKLTPRDQETQQYRDRAAQRRQEEKKAGTGGGTQKVGFSLKKGANAFGSSSETEAATTKPSYGKGMNMLQKAGWSEGQGLGSSTGTSIAAPIDQSLYASGVGLGHQGSKVGDAVEEAQRLTTGDGFQEKVKEMARKRYYGEKS